MINVWGLLTTQVLLQSFSQWKINRLNLDYSLTTVDFQFDKPGTQDSKRASKQLRHVNAARSLATTSKEYLTDEPQLN